MLKKFGNPPPIWKIPGYAPASNVFFFLLVSVCMALARQGIGFQSPTTSPKYFCLTFFSSAQFSVRQTLWSMVLFFTQLLLPFQKKKVSSYTLSHLYVYFYSVEIGYNEFQELVFSVEIGSSLYTVKTSVCCNQLERVFWVTG